MDKLDRFINSPKLFTVLIPLAYEELNYYEIIELEHVLYKKCKSRVDRKAMSIIIRFLSRYELNAVDSKLLQGNNTHGDWEFSKEEVIAELKELIRSVKAN